MIRLGAYGKATGTLDRVLLGRITRIPVPTDARRDYVLAGRNLDPAQMSGYVGAVTTDRLSAAAELRTPAIHSLETLDHLAEGDVVALNPGGYLRTLYRAASLHNAIFATDRCSSYCLMCSQPPKEVDDSDRLAEHLRLIELMSADTAEVGITGGEPTLLKDGLITIIERCKQLLPAASLHVLSNGRLFYYSAFARRVAAIKHPDLMFGVPLYSDIDSEHDYVVQAKGAFDDTMIGLHNMGRYGVRVEVRVVIHGLTYRRLPQLAEFIYRNVPFASHVALMGLELMGFAVPNLASLWVDPWDYQAELEAATLFLADRGMTVSVYNHQLCTLPQTIWPFARRSISDWKLEYLPECGACAVRSDCGGFFTSGVQRRVSGHIQPLPSAALGDQPRG